MTNDYHVAYLCIDLLKSIPSYSDSTAHVFDSICDNPCLQFSTAVFSLLMALLFFEISSLYFLQTLFETITSQLRNLLEILNYYEPKNPSFLIPCPAGKKYIANQWRKHLIDTIIIDTIITLNAYLENIRLINIVIYCFLWSCIWLLRIAVFSIIL